MADTKDLTITQGKTFSLVVRWETEPVIRKAITAISLASGAPRPTVAAHGLTNGWLCYITRAKGMPQINAANNPPRDTDYHPATVIDANTVELNDIDPVDANGREWPAYDTGGFLCWNTPVDLTGYTAAMSILDRAPKGVEKIANLWKATTVYAAGQYVVLADRSVLLCKTGGTSGSTQPTAAGTDGTVVWEAAANFVGPKELYRLTSPSGGIVIDNTAKTITLTIAATTTDDFAWKTGVCELEMTSQAGVVTGILSRDVVVSKERTT